jgi:hypothetical protein
MFLYNTFQWPWTRIASLVAPRALLFTNSDHDRIFPMYANDRIINRLKRVYSFYGRSDFVGAAVSMGGHAYRKDLRQAAFRFINMQLKDDPRVVEDSEVDLVTGSGKDRTYPIPIDRLRVFPEDSDIPKDELNTTIDEHFVPMADVAPPKEGAFDDWKSKLVAELRRITFRCFPERIPPAKLSEQVASELARIETEPGIVVPLTRIAKFKPTKETKRILLVVRGPDMEGITAFMHKIHVPEDVMYVCEPRGIGATRWTRKNPPNYVERSHVLLGRTVDTGRVRDVVSAARYLRKVYEEKVPVVAVGEGPAGVLAAYAALWEPDIEAVILSKPPLTHMANSAPQLLNVLRVCDIPEVLGMLAPRSVTIHADMSPTLEKAASIHAAAGGKKTFVVRSE